MIFYLVDCMITYSTIVVKRVHYRFPSFFVSFVFASIKKKKKSFLNLKVSLTFPFFHFTLLCGLQGNFLSGSCTPNIKRIHIFQRNQTTVCFENLTAHVSDTLRLFKVWDWCCENKPQDRQQSLYSWSLIQLMGDQLSQTNQFNSTTMCVDGTCAIWVGLHAYLHWVSGWLLVRSTSQQHHWGWLAWKST